MPRPVAPERAPAPRSSRRAGTASPGGLSRGTITILTSAGVLLPGALLLTLALMRPARRSKVAAPAAASAAALAPAAQPGCVIDKPARRLAESAFLSVPTLIATAPDGAHAAVGLAASKERALGLIVDPRTLSTTPAFEQTVTDSTTLGVIPLVRSGTLEFSVDRADPKLAFARTVDAPTRFSIGVTSEGLSRAVGATLDLIWPAQSKTTTITTPRVATVPGTGHAVVFRSGGQDGKVLFGWLRDDGTKLSDLKAIATDAALSGTPTVGANDTAVLVSFAAKAAPEEGWHIELATGLHRSLVERSKPLELPAQGPGGEAISPSVEGLTDGRFLLQWTEGSAGNRAVRAQMIAASLVPLGDPITLSTSDQNAGQGTLWAHGNQALALFLVKKDASHELWGASLKCQ